MSFQSTKAPDALGDAQSARRFRIKYLVLTLGLFLPLIWSFATVRNVYPIASWNVMMRGGNLQNAYTYFVLRGETTSGEVIDLPAVELSDALRSRNWGLVAATAGNASLKLRSPHPKNAALLSGLASPKDLPDGLLMKELLRTWGDIYNAGHPPSSPYHLKAVRLDCYQWPGGQYTNYQQFVQSWREEL